MIQSSSGVVYNFDDKEGQGSAILKCCVVIREAFKKTSLELDGPPKCVSSGLIHSNSEYFGFEILERDRSTYSGENYHGGYIAIKVSLMYS